MSGIVKNDEEKYTIYEFSEYLKAINDYFSDQLKNLKERGITNETYITELVDNFKNMTPDLVKSFRKLERYLNDFVPYQKRVADWIKLFENKILGRNETLKERENSMNKDMSSLDFAVNYLTQIKKELMKYTNDVVGMINMIFELYKQHMEKEGKAQSDLSKGTLFTQYQQIIAQYKEGLCNHINTIDTTELKNPKDIINEQYYELPQLDEEDRYHRRILNLDKNGFKEDSFVEKVKNDVERDMNASKETLSRLEAYKRLAEPAEAAEADRLKDKLEVCIKQVYSVSDMLLASYAERGKNPGQDLDPQAKNWIVYLSNGKIAAVNDAGETRKDINIYLDSVKAVVKKDSVKHSKTDDGKFELSSVRNRVVRREDIQKPKELEINPNKDKEPQMN